jgi:hypothetical protein
VEVALCRLEDKTRSFYSFSLVVSKEPLVDGINMRQKTRQTPADEDGTQ